MNANGFERSLWQQMKRWQFWIEIAAWTAIVIIVVMLWLAL